MATKYNLTTVFTAITETSGTIQNVGNESVELASSTNAVVGEGIVLNPGEKRSFKGALSARSIGDAGAAVNVVDFTEAGEGGEEYVLPVATTSRLGGVKSSDVVGKITVNADGTMTYNAPTPSVTPVVSTAWAANTVYKVNNVVGYGGHAYICLKDHTSTSNFDADFANGDWDKIDAPKAGANGYVQAQVLGVTGATSSTPYIKSLAINQTNSFIFPPIEVLEEAAGESALVNALHFDNADATDFNYDSYFVKFDGTMHLKTEYDIPMSTPTQITDGTNTGYISESDNIDFGDWDNVEGVDVR